MSGDHLERLYTFGSDWQAAMDDDLVSEVIAVINGRPLRKSDLGAALNELKQLRAQQTSLDGQAFVAGWYAHAEACASLGWDQRETAWRKYRTEMAETLAKDVPQQPVPEPGPPTRRSVLLAAIQREGGDWSPLRARTALVSAGYAVESNRAHQIMKTLAAHGYLEQVRPRAHTYRLKTEVLQQPEHSATTCAFPGCLHPDHQRATARTEES